MAKPTVGTATIHGVTCRTCGCTDKRILEGQCFECYEGLYDALDAGHIVPRVVDIRDTRLSDGLSTKDKVRA